MMGAGHNVTQGWGDPPPEPDFRPVISARYLTKWYGMVQGINNVDIDMRPGITALIGPNGAGKSTFLKLATGQLRPSAGHVWALGERVFGNSGLMARIGYCPEQDSFYRGMTGLEFVATLLGIAGYGRKDAVSMAEDSIRTVGMKNAKDRKISGYSKGMRQRIKVAQAIAHDPDLLILDEPLAGTDPVGRGTILKVIRKMERDGRDVLLSSHVLHDIERITRQIVLINKGKVIAQGDVHEIRGLIDMHPHVVRIRTREGRRLGALLAENDKVSSIEFEQGVVVIRTPEPTAFYRELPGLIHDNGIACTEIQSPDDNLDAVFRYLVEG